MFSSIVKNMKSKGSSFIIVSHRKEEIDALCDSIYKIDGGSLTILRDLYNNDGVQ
ncbi:hypothetical protein [Clostridium estertheticum]|uniref:hypothetical protein n=1 Tax=Clostridium estertheticum TaxID=238834 RepID=UPI001CF2DC7A|nr:hypothetical protein [Clostridium estertheticum]MCB2354882.1 hypothetical protein [Clostridium estertheticum]WAG41122.1 hypothetical protein LL065_23295 [Clostridium estertheticum]